MRKTIILTLSLVFLFGCRTYLIDKESAAKQMTNLKFERESGDGGVRYYTDLNHLIIKNDTIIPFDIKFYLKSGTSWGYINPNTVLFKERDFITFKDTTLETHPKCKLCRINIDSIEKIAIRAPRKINFPSYNASRWHVDYRIGITTNFVNSNTSKYYDTYLNLGFGTAYYYRNIMFSYCFNPTSISRFKTNLYNQYGDTIKEYRKDHGSYWTNIMKHNFDLGYEIKFNDKNSIIPTMGFSLWSFRIIESSNVQNKIQRLHDFNLGISYRRFVSISNNARFFYGLQGYAIYSNAPDKFSSLGNYYWTATVTCGFKFVPRGVVALSILSGLGNGIR
jgi:hypothetical protein